MKKIVLAFLLLNICLFEVNALEANRKKVDLIKCEDALSSWVNIDGVKTRIRLIATDTSDGKLNSEIDDYVCNTLEKATTIELVFDPNNKTLDEYNRLNVWIYVDSKLLQEDLIEKGYAQVNYVNGEYLYLNKLCDKQRQAIQDGIGIWQYPNQVEKYCNSGINIENNSSNEVVAEIQNKRKDYSNLYDMISLYLFIIVLGIIIKLKRN